MSLAPYTAEQRTNEVSIRKVMGAGNRQVIALFVWLFIKVFLLSALIAVPEAWFVAYEWLQGFAYRISISPMTFAVSLMGLLLEPCLQ